MPQAVGCTEQERTVAIEMLREGASMKDVKKRFAGVEADYFDANEADFLILAGKKPKRAATELEKEQAAVILAQVDQAEKPTHKVADLKRLFPHVDPKTLIDAKPDKKPDPLA